MLTWKQNIHIDELTKQNSMRNMGNMAQTLSQYSHKMQTDNWAIHFDRAEVAYQFPKLLKWKEIKIIEILVLK